MIVDIFQVCLEEEDCANIHGYLQDIMLMKSVWEDSMLDQDKVQRVESS